MKPRPGGRADKEVRTGGANRGPASSIHEEECHEVTVCASGIGDVDQSRLVIVPGHQFGDCVAEFNVGRMR